jgi:3-hydroxyisobutyrate dehydrogenase-like beta-hydroxyacid dehydrogenase
MYRKVGFIGLGDIGRPMARCILEGGFGVVSCAHVRREAIDALKVSGLVELQNPLEVARRSDVLITMVVDEAQTDAVLKGPNGALAGLGSHTMIVVMSTVSPRYCQKLAEEAALRGIGVIDCPVSGGRPRAERGALSLMAGGPPEAIEKCRPILDTMGTLRHCGGIGMGQVAKLVNNGLTAGHYAQVKELRAMAAAHGMDMTVLMDVLKSASGNSFVVENWDFLEANWSHLGPNARKDMDLCLASARDKSVPVPVTEAAGRIAQAWRR